MNSFIHIGLHKTGTTFLQETYFPTLPDLVLVRGIWPFRSILDAREKKLLISDEAISGNPFGGAWLDEFRTNLLFLKKLFRDPAIIVGFRQHDSFLLSLYKQYLHQGGTREIKCFFEPTGQKGYIKPQELRYGPRISFLQENFKDIFVYTQEELTNDFEGFQNDFIKFTNGHLPNDKFIHINNVKKNVGVKGVRQANLLLLINRVTQKMSNEKKGVAFFNKVLRRLKLDPRGICQHRLSRLPSKPLVLPEHIRQFVNDTYRKDWCEMEKLRLLMRRESKVENQWQIN